MKKTMKLTYLLTLLVLLFSFTACGNSDEKKDDKETTTVEDNKDKDTEATEDEKDSEDASSEDASSEDTTTTEPATGSSYSLADITYTVSDEWTYTADNSTEGSLAAFQLPTSDSAKDQFMNNFMVQVTNVGAEVSEEELKSSADLFIQAYEESFDATLVSQDTLSTPCGTAMAFTLDVTKMLESQGMSGVPAYIKQVIFVKGTNSYIMQLTCVTDDFEELSKGMDATIASIVAK